MPPPLTLGCSPRGHHWSPLNFGLPLSLQCEVTVAEVVVYHPQTFSIPAAGVVTLGLHFATFPRLHMPQATAPASLDGPLRCCAPHVLCFKHLLSTAHKTLQLPHCTTKLHHPGRPQAHHFNSTFPHFSRTFFYRLKTAL